MPESVSLALYFKCLHFCHWICHNLTSCTSCNIQKNYRCQWLAGPNCCNVRSTKSHTRCMVLYTNNDTTHMQIFTPPLFCMPLYHQSLSRSLFPTPTQAINDTCRLNHKHNLLLQFLNSIRKQSIKASDFWSSCYNIIDMQTHKSLTFIHKQCSCATFNYSNEALR